MIMVDNVMQMRQVTDGWLIAPGSFLTLSPGGKHVMLMGLKQNMKNLSEVTLEFNIEGIGWVAVPADVRAPKI